MKSQYLALSSTWKVARNLKSQNIYYYLNATIIESRRALFIAV